MEESKSEYNNKRARVMRVVMGFVRGDHTKYDFNLAFDRFRFFDLFSRTLSISKYIEKKKITDADYGDFYYLLKVMEERRVKTNKDEFIVKGMTRINKGKIQDTTKLPVALLDEMYKEIIKGKPVDRKTISKKKSG